MRLIAIKPNTYGTRHLQAGDEFEIGDRYARTLLVTGLAKVAGGKPDDLIELRAAAQTLGIDVDKRWGARRLQAEIDMARKWG